MSGSVALDGTGLLNHPASQAYPFVGMSFIVFRSYSAPMAAAALTSGASYSAVNCTLAAELLRYYRWVNRDPGAQDKLSAFSAVSIPNATYDIIMNTILRRTFLCTNTSASAVKGQPKPVALVWDALLAALANEVPPDYVSIVFVYILTPLLCLLAVYHVALALISLSVLSGKTTVGQYRIASRDIAFIETSKERYRAMLRTRPFLDSQLDSPFITGEFGPGVVLLRPVDMEFNNAPLRVREELIHMQEWRTHRNLVKFLGVTEFNRGSYIVSELSK